MKIYFKDGTNKLLIVLSDEDIDRLKAGEVIIGKSDGEVSLIISNNTNIDNIIDEALPDDDLEFEYSTKTDI